MVGVGCVLAVVLRKSSRRRLRDGGGWWLPWLLVRRGGCRRGAVVSGELTVEGAVVAGEVDGCVEGGREIRVRVSCVRWRR